MFLCGLLLAAAVPAAAQQRPLVTEDPETVGTGNILIEGGVDGQKSVAYPASGLEGDLLRVGTLGLSLGFSSILELQIDGGIYDRLSVESRVPAPLSDKLDFTGDTTHDVDDLYIATKIRVVSEGPSRPSIGIRLATKLPTASNESGLGLDTMDFHATALMAKTVNAVRVVGNVGVGILSDPIDGQRQNDVVLYGVSVARALQQGFEFVGEINGRLNTRNDDIPTGTETRSIIRVGARLTRGAVRVDGGLLFGLTSNDPSFGFTAGLTYVFKGFTLP
ncbi:MAG TPA: hypothetical protein VFJ02_14045 [Vicinamibacterales bacterium]|nr:hypothetical protein [Vicinamibacterales bacterium]